ncbi:MAG: YbjQ family protein [Thermoleophilia bacterium]|nr:YbjQ family protein [Thermoleophilia bacterium]
MSKLFVTTMNDIPGYQVQSVLGEVFGVTVRSRNMFSDIGAGLKGLVGGEVKGYTKLLEVSREEAVDRLRTRAQEMGANAVVAFRFDCNEIASNMTEIAAYGTAAVVVPSQG